MWSVRILSGPQAGQVFQLSEGANTVGRSESSNIQLNSPGVSKVHCHLVVSGNTIEVVDKGSRNGTFLNGLQVVRNSLKNGDRISFFDVIVEVEFSQPMATPLRGGDFTTNNYEPQAENAFASQEHEDEDGKKAVSPGLKGFIEVAQNYIDDIILPGVYKLAHWMEFKWVVGLFVLAFIVFVTSLSSVPLVRILKSSIEKESQRRALTIARTLARVNRIPLMNGLESSVSVDIAAREPGVDKAYIISEVDGNILAPSRMAGRYPKDKFIHTARKLGKESVDQINDDTIGAMVPIEFYNSQTGAQSVTAYAVVIYNMGALAVDDGRTLSLFIQTFFIALIIGSLLFFFLYRLIRHPIDQMNEQLNVLLRDGQLEDGSQTLSTDYKFPALENLVSNVSSAISRIQYGGGEDSQQQMEYDRTQEMNHLVQLIGFPALAISAVDQTIAAVNPAFEELSGTGSHELVYHAVNSINDQSLQLSLVDLVERVSSAPDQLANNELEFAGINHELVAQAVYGEKDIAYMIIVVLPKEEMEASA